METTELQIMANGLVAVVAILAVAVPGVWAEFNYTKCPAPWELQTDAVSQNFSLDKFAGSYYELALHDYTQYPICPSPKCVRSHKVIDYQHKMVNDSFSLTCFGVHFPVAFKFHFTNTTGFFLGKVVHLPEITFPNTVVDVLESSSGEYYQWVIEFQCVEKLDRVWFVGINWYSRSFNVTEGYLDEMLNAARKRGLGFYMDSGLKVRIVDQKDCGYAQKN